LLRHRQRQATPKGVQDLRQLRRPLQFSVFECDLNPSEKIELETELSEIINHDEDQVIFVALGPAEGRGDRVITALGLPYVKLDAPCYVV
jgi:CRISPR-associated protein Cas2